MSQTVPKKRIPVAGPSITEKEIRYVTDAVTNAWYGDANMYHDRFEKAFAEYIGAKFAVALPSCTSAIHLALAAAGVGPGDEVIVPEATWIATAAPISYVGATPVFADIEEDTWCLSARSLNARITPRTKAVIPVDLYGGVCDYDAILAVARRHNLFVIEDAAEAVGASYRGRMAGSMGDVGVFSFHGSKTLTTGEGGMLVTDRKDVLERVMTLRDHGRIPGPRLFWNGEVAYKYKMSSLQAALGLAQLERIDELVTQKREIFSWYKEYISKIPGVQLNFEPAGTKNQYWMVTCAWGPRYPRTKEEVLARLISMNVDARPFFYPLSSLPAYAGQRQASQPNLTAERVCAHAINLPSALTLTRADVAYVAQAFVEALSA